MDRYTQREDVILYGMHVNSFPIGIKESFDILMDAFGSAHSYYGISWIAEDESIQYYAAVSVPSNSDAKHDNYEKLKISKGEYLTTTVHNWLSKTDSIKDVFHELLSGDCPDINRPCIEWYKSDEEMLCMVRLG